MANKLNLTQRFIRSVKPTDRTVIYWDTTQPGLGLRVTKTGAAAYVVNYRVGGKAERPTIGNPSENTLAEMREEARNRRAQARRGTTRQAQALTVQKLYDLWMQHKVLIDCKLGTVENYQARWRTHLQKRFGRMTASKVRVADVTALRTSMKDNQRTFNLCADVLRALFNWGVENEYLPYETANPVRRNHYFKLSGRETALTRDQVVNVLRAIDELEEQPRGISRHAAAAIKVIMLTGARLREVLHAKWEWLENESLELPDSKTGPKTIPLAGAALEIIEGLPHAPNNPYIFIGQKPGRPLHDLTTPWERVCIRAGLQAGREGVVIHDLRHSYATLAASMNVPLTALGRVLGHSSADMTQRYINTHDDEARQAAEQVAEEHARLIEKSANVVPLRKRAS